MPMLTKIASVVPAYAGVIPSSCDDIGPLMCGPRIRGGDPLLLVPTGRIYLWSPHTRG